MQTHFKMAHKNGNTYNFKVVLLGEGIKQFRLKIHKNSYKFMNQSSWRKFIIDEFKYVDIRFLGAVGKTSLVLRYVEDTFNSNHITTLQVNVFSTASLV